MFNNSISFLPLTNYSVDNANGRKEIPPLLEGKVEVGVMYWCKGQWSRLLDSYGLSNIQPLLSYHLLTDRIYTAVFSGCFRILAAVFFFFKTKGLILYSYRLSRFVLGISDPWVSHNNARFPKPGKNNLSIHNYVLWIFFADATFWQTAKSL